MTVIGTVASLWRYPVKSMRGERLDEVFLGAGGVRGDRLFAFKGSARPESFPYFTGREQPAMLLYRPRPGQGGSLAVETPSGATLAIDDPALIAQLSEDFPGEIVTLMRADHAIADCHPLSLLSLQTARQLGTEIGTTLDERRFRANVYLDLADGEGFGEDALVGRTLRIGDTATVAIIDRDPRCAMITLDPDSTEHNPAVLARVATAHQGKAGVYAAVRVEGMLRIGDAVTTLT